MHGPAWQARQERKGMVKKMNVSREVDACYNRLWEDMERRRMQEEAQEEYEQQEKKEENGRKSDGDDSAG